MTPEEKERIEEAVDREEKKRIKEMHQRFMDGLRENQVHSMRVNRGFNGALVAGSLAILLFLFQADVLPGESYEKIKIVIKALFLGSLVLSFGGTALLGIVDSGHKGFTVEHLERMERIVSAFITLPSYFLLILSFNLLMTMVSPALGLTTIGLVFYLGIIVRIAFKWKPKEKYSLEFNRIINEVDKDHS